jgi:hypothetical protein
MKTNEIKKKYEDLVIQILKVKAITSYLNECFYLQRNITSLRGRMEF